MKEEDDLLDTILQGSSKTFEIEDVILEPLLEEINSITEESIRFFVRAMLLKVDLFWEGPASLTLDLHPPDEYCIGGNVLHTKRAAQLIELFCDSKDRTPLEHDILMAAILLHDITKVYKKDNEDWAIDPMHSYTVDRIAAKTFTTEDVQGSAALVVIAPEILSQILRLIRCSHGAWVQIPETMPLTTMEWIVHDADHIASNLHKIQGVSFDQGPETATQTLATTE